MFGYIAIEVGIIYDPYSGYSVYMLSKNVGTSGGATTTGISFDQIIAMVATSLDLAISAAAFYSIVNAYVMLSAVTLPMFILAAAATYALVTAVFNYVYTLAIVNEACNGDAACQEYLQDERAWYLLDIGLIVGVTALSKIGRIAKSNYYKNRVPNPSNRTVPEGSAKVPEDMYITMNDEAPNFTEYNNFAGNTVKVPKQSAGSIPGAIDSAVSSADVGKSTEGKVAKYIKDQGIEIIDFGNKVKGPGGNLIGDIDVSTSEQLIEVKHSISSVKVEQMDKYINPYCDKFFNFGNKEVVLYVDEAIDMSNAYNVSKIEELRENGVIVVNGLDELGEVLK